MDHPLLNAFWMMLYFFLWIMWFMLLFRVLADLFRDHSISGWVKTGWIILVCILPFLGVFIYLIARGSGMASRDQKQMAEADRQFKAAVRDAAASDGGSQADQLAKLADLRDKGTLSEAEFQQAKAKILA